MYILFAVVNGALAVASRIVNASLSDQVGDLGGSFVNHAVGWGVASVLLVLGLGQEGGSWSAAPWWAWSGGVMGVLVVAASNFAVRRAGAALFGVLIVAGQLATSAVIDHFGLFGQTPIQVTPMRLAGLVFLAGGAALIVSDDGEDPAGSDSSTTASEPKPRLPEGEPSRGERRRGEGSRE